jgi:hypothetical protein
VGDNGGVVTNDPARATGVAVLAKQELEGAATALCQWLGDRVGHFLALGREADGELSHGKFGPLGEFALALVALTNPKYASSVPQVHAWATGQAQALCGEAGRLGAGLRWDSYEAALDRDREAGVAWMFIPATEMAAGTPTGLRDRLAEGLRDRLPMRQDLIVSASPDFLLFLELLGVRDCTAELSRPFRRIVDQTLRQAGLPRCPDLYDATHAIFYLTRFGRLPDRRVGLPAQFRDRLCLAARRQADEGDIDLAAEIVASLLYAGFPVDGAVREMTTRIAAGIEPDGGVVSTRGQFAAVSRSFRDCYHPTLVSLMALAEASHAMAAP